MKIYKFIKNIFKRRSYYFVLVDYEYNFRDKEDLKNIKGGEGLMCLKFIEEIKLDDNNAIIIKAIKSTFENPDNMIMVIKNIIKLKEIDLIKLNRNKRILKRNIKIILYLLINLILLSYILCN